MRFQHSRSARGRLALATALCTASLFNSAHACGTIACDEVPNSVIAWANGSVAVYMDDPSTLNCTPMNDGGLKIEASAKGRDMMYAALLSAKHANKAILVRIDDGSNPCTVRYIRQVE